jgi:hypothetical protein
MSMGITDGEVPNSEKHSVLDRGGCPVGSPHLRWHSPFFFLRCIALLFFVITSIWHHGRRSGFQRERGCKMIPHSLFSMVGRGHAFHCI